HTILAPYDEGGASFRLLSCDAADAALGADWDLHADGRVQPAGLSTGERLDLAALRERCHSPLARRGRSAVPVGRSLGRTASSASPAHRLLLAAPGGDFPPGGSGEDLRAG